MNLFEHVVFKYRGYIHRSVNWSVEIIILTLHRHTNGVSFYVFPFPCNFVPGSLNPCNPVPGMSCLAPTHPSPDCVSLASLYWDLAYRAHFPYHVLYSLYLFCLLTFLSHVHCPSLDIPAILMNCGYKNIFKVVRNEVRTLLLLRFFRVSCDCKVLDNVSCWV